jgi:two-component system nitrogen regulation response regulator GlnG
MVLASGNTITLAALSDEIAHGHRTHAAASPASKAEASAPVFSAAVPSMPEGESASAGGAPGKNALAQAIDTLFSFARHDKQLKLLPAAERELIVRALAETSGNQVQAAKLLGVTRATLRKRVDKFGIQKRMAID